MRWRVLVAFVFAALVTQLLWLNFAPLLVDVQKTYAVTDDVASLLVLPFPLLYVFLSLPAGRLIDKRGYRAVVGGGMIVTALGAVVRIDSDRFASLLAGQVIIAVAQPFVVNGINKLVADWFSDDEAALATGLGTVGMFIGMALGLATTPPLVVAFDMRTAMIANAAFAAAVAVMWFALARERAPTSRSHDVGNTRDPVDAHVMRDASVGRDPASRVATSAEPSSWGALLRNKRLLVLAALGVLGLGYFNGLTTWLEQLLAPRGLDAEQAGAVGGVIIGGGIVGAIIVPIIADKLRRRRAPLVLCALLATACSAWLAFATTFATTMVSAAALGFFFMPAFALLLTMTGEVVDKRDNGAATALVMLAGNGGGVVVIVAMGALGDWSGRTPWISLLALAAVTAAIAFAAPETAVTRTTTPR